MRRSYLIMLVAAVCLGGCGGESSEDQGGSEHFVPPHWPQDLDDAAEKIRQRAELLRTAAVSGEAVSGEADRGEADRGDAEKELRDIVGWIPEVAADTNLNEQQWLPIYLASDSLSAQLRRMPRPLDMRTLAEIASYCELLETQAKWITVEPVTEDGFRAQTDARIEDEDTP